MIKLALRLTPLIFAFSLAAAIGCGDSSGGGCGGQPTYPSSTSQQTGPTVTCGPGTMLQSGQCVPAVNTH